MEISFFFLNISLATTIGIFFLSTLLLRSVRLESERVPTSHLIIGFQARWSLRRESQMEGEESTEGNGDVYVSSSPPPPSVNTKPPLVSSRRKGGIFGRRGMSMEEEDFGNLLHGSDPLMVELNRLENEVKGFCFILFYVYFLSEKFFGVY